MHVKKLLFIRHGVTAWNQQARFQGNSDTPLSEEGQEQALKTAAYLKDWGAESLYASPLLRARETAEIIRSKASAPNQFILDDALREMSFGCWEGLTVAEIQREQGDHFQRWQVSPFLNVPKGGECWESLRQRANDFAQQLVQMEHGRAIIVAHGGILRAIFSALLRLDSADFFWSVRLDNCSLTEFSVRPIKTQLLYLNDTHHLKSS